MIKKLSLVSLFTLLPASFYFAQTTVFAYVKDSQGKPVEQAEVDVKGAENDVTADKIGYFQLVDLQPGHYQLVITKPNYETKVMEFDVANDEKRKDLGVVTLYSSLTTADQGLAIIDSNDDDEDSSQASTVGLLQSSMDVYSRIAAFDLGFYWFRPRGIDGRSGETMMNGVSMVKSDNGSVDFSNWGGLNEITRYPEISQNHAPSEYAFGGNSSVIYKNTKASEYRKGFQFTQSLTNRNYRNRTSLRYTSGMNSKGWAFTVMGARRWAEEGIQEGTFYDAYGTYLGVEKKFNDKHSMTFNFIGSPYRRSTASPSTQEVYDYRGVHYNSYWGYQDGEKRSERVRRGFQPIFQLQDFWKINTKSSLWTTASYQFGKDRGSRLDWNGVTNPSPQYYRNLPSYYINSIIYNATNNSLNPALYTTLTDAYNTSLQGWLNGDPSITQINWDRLYENNQKNDVVDQAEMSRLYNLSGKRSKVYMVDDVSDDKIFNAGTHYTYNFNDRTKFILNASYQNYRSELYREMKDLLGGDYAINVDPFKESARPGSTGFYNTNDSDVEVKVGDRMTYNYIIRRQDVKINPGLKLSTGNFDVFVSALAGYSTSNREGLFKHYLYENSEGKSKDYNFWNFGLKAQVVYRINGRNFLVYNGAMYNQAPFLEDLFINPRVNALVNPSIRSTVYTANDLSYVISTPFLKLRATGYLVDTQNETNVQRFFADGIQLNNTNPDGSVSQVQSAFVTQVMSNVEKRNMGAELGVDVKVLPTLSLQGLASYGQFTYRNNPDVYLVSDASGSSVTSFGQAYIKNYKQGGTPQQAYSLGLRYNNPKYWWVGANWNYLDDNYLDPSPALRTNNFIQNPFSSTPFLGLDNDQVRDMLRPVKLPSAFFLNANAGKSFVFGKYYLLLTASVNNILDNKRYITGGFEQTRETKAADFAADFYSPTPSFGPKYWYTQGRSYFVNLQFRF
ncbi:carboxypeptidase regulatory-like domain-containing protein [Chryseobacterium chendengshani]|uniref:carboxypeptidase regulatory-like domain-containing protein n=1 Tax=Chryseobacterium sp. LJ668 TaxID=2864040 RepID=UPI001C68AC72|nr:carboxypeptidase regulatory-like domain-containing protein [Chryseobacterium sp. LJ668]MBW8521880.1 carboxypeptidase regulatory-like domain-containing protein [Chryseobacterium sp. LJ668]QYK17539.1 carboxypeptidase regulatory-like domain-containing protein [Chryseobacterium sp. LJ668]